MPKPYETSLFGSSFAPQRSLGGAKLWHTMDDQRGEGRTYGYNNRRP